MSNGSQPPARQAPDEATQAAIKAVSRKTLLFGVCMVAVLLCSRLPLPWSLAGIGFAVAAFVFGLRAIAAIRDTPAVGTMQLLIVIGMALTAFTAIGLVGQAVLYQDYASYQTCRSQAITEEAAAACDTQFVASIRNLFPALAPLFETP